MQKHCLYCHSLFSKDKSISKKTWETRTKFCSIECSGLFKKGKPIKHLKNAQFKKGFTPWNKGLTKKTDKRVAKISGENHYEWKGEKVSYGGLHNWVKKELGTPSKCEHCGSTSKKYYEWANRSGKYKRKLSDWIRLCKPCHQEFDNIHVKMWETRRSGQAGK